MSVLVHACCGPCLGGSAPELLRQHESLVLFWENPNIHPYLEYRARLEAFHAMAEKLQLPVTHGRTEYGLDAFLRALQMEHGPGRCAICYKLRFESAARRARDLGCEGFTTTLTISPYQKHEVIRRVGEEVAAAVGVPFVYHDLQPFFRDTHRAAKENNLYKQKYCGCLFSEFDRYQHDPKFALPECRDEPPES